MFRSLRSALARFAVRRAAACQRHAPKRAAWWLEIGCALTPVFAESYPALVRLRRAIEDRWGALAAAQEAGERFPENPAAWLLLGAAGQMVVRQQEALVAHELALARPTVEGEGIAEQDDGRHDVGRHEVAGVLWDLRHRSVPARAMTAHTAGSRTRRTAA